MKHSSSKSSRSAAPIANSICRLSTIAALGLGVLLPGCKDRRPAGADLYGTVTWNGQPVPTGYIVFSPDTTKGGAGHQGMAPIKDGRFDTREKNGRRVAFGPQIAMIAGFDTPLSTSQERGPRLFTPWERPVDVTESTGELNFVVPGSVQRLKPASVEE